MKAVAAALAFFHLVFPFSAVGQSPTPARGCVVYKLASEAWASVVEYKTLEDFGTNITVTNSAGEQVRIFSDQNPIFIPYPSDTSATAEKARAQIQQARKRYPERSSRLAVVEKAWAAVPASRQQPATVPRSGTSVPIGEAKH